MSILTHVSLDLVIQDSVLDRLVSMPDMPAVEIHDIDRQWVVDACCGVVHISWELTPDEATAALDDALDALEFARLRRTLEAA
ncbi:MAG: hypothetical protein OJJ54_17890 [Pseudonocardia sp.]|nr:hypothetical protein [Pseudonocardia sp.]